MNQIILDQAVSRSKKYKFFNIALNKTIFLLLKSVPLIPEPKFFFLIIQFQYKWRSLSTAPASLKLNTKLIKPDVFSF